MASITHTSTIANLLQLDELPVVEQAAFLDEVGALIMESASIRFLTEADESMQERFSEFVAINGEAKDFLEQLVEVFPEFAVVMADEMKHFEAETRALIGE